MEEAKTSKSDNNAIIRFSIKSYFDNDIQLASEKTGYTAGQIKRWMTDKTTPRIDTVRYFMAIALIPEFKIVCELSSFSHDENISSQINKMLNGHHNSPGIYAFYDSLCEPIYIGKANSSLQAEIISALGRSVSILYPKSIQKPPTRVRELVKHVSADVGGVEHYDYPKHVESLILRIKKPKLNKQTGNLTKVIPKKPEE